MADPLSVQQVQAKVASAGSVACPMGTAVLSGGFRSSRPMQASRPQGNGWYGASFDTSAQIYALCAAQRVLSGSVVTSGFNAHSSSNSYYPGDGSVNCPANQVATSGGFEGGDLILVSGRHETSSSGWFVEAGGDGDVTIYALCVVFRR